MLGLIRRSLGRTPVRLALTVGAIAVLVVASILLRTFVSAWQASSTSNRDDRLATRARISWATLFPAVDVPEIRELPGVAAAVGARWFNAKDAQHRREFFINLAVDPRAVLEVYDDFVVSDGERDAWIGDRTGALVGDALASARGWHLGDRVTLTGGIYPGDFTFTVRAIYHAPSSGLNRSQFFFHYDFLDDLLTRKGMVGAVMVRTQPHADPAEVAHAIDQHFRSSPYPTLTQAEGELARQFRSVFSAIMHAIDALSLALLVVMGLAVGNTIAMNVRDRTHEHAVMRAIGFRPAHVIALVVGEAAAVGLMGGVLGLALAVPLVDLGVRRWIETHMVGFFPVFAPPLPTRIAAVLVPTLLASLAALWPALLAGRRRVIDGLRRTG